MQCNAPPFSLTPKQSVCACVLVCVFACVCARVRARKRKHHRCSVSMFSSPF